MCRCDLGRRRLRVVHPPIGRPRCSHEINHLRLLAVFAPAIRLDTSQDGEDEVRDGHEDGEGNERLQQRKVFVRRGFARKGIPVAIIAVTVPAGYIVVLTAITVDLIVAERVRERGGERDHDEDEENVEDDVHADVCAGVDGPVDRPPDENSKKLSKLPDEGGTGLEGHVSLLKFTHSLTRLLTATAAIMTPMNESYEYAKETRPRLRPSVVIAKTKFKHARVSLATLKGLLGLNFSTLGSSNGRNCGCCPTGWICCCGVLCWMAAGFSGMFVPVDGAALECVMAKFLSGVK